MQYPAQLHPSVHEYTCVMYIHYSCITKDKKRYVTVVTEVFCAICAQHKACVVL